MKDYKYTAELERYLNDKGHVGSFSDDRHSCSCSKPKTSTPTNPATVDLNGNVLTPDPNWRTGINPDDYGIAPPVFTTQSPGSIDLGPLLPTGVLPNEIGIVNPLDLENPATVNTVGPEAQNGVVPMAKKDNTIFWVLGGIAAIIAVRKMTKKSKA